ncbi:MAG: CapA family protein [Coriobacteriales bacterium]|nr:CapA family protein [Coriobacteriales bacterium]
MLVIGDSLSALALLGMTLLALVACAPTSETTAQQAPPVAETATPAAQPPAAQPATANSFNLMAVGDNLIHDNVYHSGLQPDGTHDYASMYAPLRAYVAAAEVAFINQETICGGEELGLSSYPFFNGPQQILDALHATGFNWINTASNHALDRGEAGILAQLSYLQRFDGLVQTGTHATAQDAATPTVIERNGVRIGLASYTYGLNGLEPPAGKTYLVDVIDREKIERDLAALLPVSDVQIVNMHWGDEYSLEVTDEQRELAQFLADQGVDVVLGEHPHVVQPTVFVTGAQGNRTLVAYSLGNVLSSQVEPECLLGELLQCTISLDAATGAVEISDVAVVPLVTHISRDYTAFTTYPLVDYTEELAGQHALSIRIQDFSLTWLKNLATQVFGE